MKFWNSKELFPKEKESGVTLLITVFVVATVALISVTIGSFAIEEIRSSRAVVLSEPAIVAAEAGGEQSLWALKRGGVLNNCSNPTTTVLTNNTVVVNCKTYGPATFSLAGNTDFSFFLYDPDDINGNLDPGYTSVTVTNQSLVFTILVTVRRLTGEVVGVPTTVGTNSVVSIPLQNQPGGDNRYKITLRPTGNSVAEVTTNLGMPEYPTISSEGCSSKGAISSCNDVPEAFKRQIDITVPQ